MGQPEEAQRSFVQPEACEGSACIADQLQFLITVLNASHRCQPFVFPATQLDCRNQKALNDGMAFQITAGDLRRQLEPAVWNVGTLPGPQSCCKLKRKVRMFWKMAVKSAMVLAIFYRSMSTIVSVFLFLSGAAH